MTKTNTLKVKLGWELCLKVYRTLLKSRETKDDSEYELLTSGGKLKLLLSFTRSMKNEYIE